MQITEICFEDLLYTFLMSGWNEKKTKLFSKETFKLHLIKFQSSKTEFQIILFHPHSDEGRTLWKSRTKPWFLLLGAFLQSSIILMLTFHWSKLSYVALLRCKEVWLVQFLFMEAK